MDRQSKRRLVVAGVSSLVGTSAAAYYMYKSWFSRREEGSCKQHHSASPLEDGFQSLDESCKAWEFALAEASQKGDNERAAAIRQVLRRAYACLDAYNSSFAKHREDSDDFSDVASFKSACSDNEQDLSGFDDFHTSPVRVRRDTSHASDLSLSPSGSKQISMWEEAMKRAKEGKIPIRKFRLQYTGAKDETDYAARVYCFRSALAHLGKSEAKRNAIRDPFMRIVTGILIKGDADPNLFVSAVEKMERFIAKQMSLDGGVCLMKELGVKGVKEFTLFDIVLDFMLFDSFDDLKCPPQAVLNALQTTWVPSSVRKRGLRGAVWACARSRRSMMPVDSFMQNFYDIAITVAPTLACGLLSVGDPEFVDLCKGFKSLMLEYIHDCFAIPGKDLRLSAEDYADKILEKTRLYSPRAIQMVSKAMK
eukprot:m.14809 g.14809  ORF g.14809 m.14809 type:complete len:422 (-) comp5211_c0_seq1:164-1429(-)